MTSEAKAEDEKLANSPLVLGDKLSLGRKKPTNLNLKS